MDSENQKPQTNGDAAEESQEQNAPEIPLNRAQRRALASGKKGTANNVGMPQQGSIPGMGNRGSAPHKQGRLQSRGSNRGK